MAAKNGSSSANTYEEARKQRVEENKRRFQDMGILNLSKSLNQLTNSEKSSKQRLPKPKPENAEVFEPRRSSRARNPVPSYCDDVDIDLPPLRKRSSSSLSSSSWISYVARPLDEIRIASYEEQTRASNAAEQFQTGIQSGKPSFVKSMVRSHVYSCFWLGLPTQFCKDHLPQKDLDITLEDENGTTYEAKYLGKRTGLSGGWRGFALDHKLDEGDAVVFELVEPEKFKVYIFRASSLSSQKHNADMVDREGSASPKKASQGEMNVELGLHSSETQKKKKKANLHSSETQKKKKKANVDESAHLLNVQQPEPVGEGRLEHVNATKNGLVSQKDDKKGKLANARKLEEVQLAEEKDKPVEPVVKPRKKPAPRLFRKKV